MLIHHMQCGCLARLLLHWLVDSCDSHLHNLFVSSASAVRCTVACFFNHTTGHLRLGSSERLSDSSLQGMGRDDSLGAINLKHSTLFVLVSLQGRGRAGGPEAGGGLANHKH